MYNFRVLGNYLFCDMEPVGDELNPVAEGLRKNVEIRLVNHTSNPQVSVNGLNNWSSLLSVPLSNITVEGVSLNLSDFLTWSTTNTGNFNSPSGGGGGATNASDLIVTPTINGLGNAQAVLSNHETRIDLIEADVTQATEVVVSPSVNSLGTAQLVFENHEARIDTLEGSNSQASAVIVNPVVNGLADAQAVFTDHENRIDTLESEVVSAIDVIVSPSVNALGTTQAVLENHEARIDAIEVDEVNASEIVVTPAINGIIDGQTLFANHESRIDALEADVIEASEVIVNPTINSLGTSQLVLSDHETRIDTLENVTPNSVPMTYGRVNIFSDLTGVVFTNANNGVKIPFNNTKYASGIAFTGTDTMTPSVTGRYRASWLMQAGSGEFAGNGYFVVMQNNVFLDRVFYDMMEAAGVNQCTGFIDVDLIEGLPVELRYQSSTTTDTIAWQSGSYFQLDQLPTAATTVVDGTVPVSDNAAGGYIDIGTWRFQSGSHDDGNIDTTTVTLPAPFSNTNYSVVVTSNTSAGSLCAESKTTTSFDIDRASTTTTTQVYSWMAVGLKP